MMTNDATPIYYIRDRPEIANWAFSVGAGKVSKHADARVLRAKARKNKRRSSK